MTSLKMPAAQWVDKEGGSSRYTYILPVLFYEFLAISVTRAVLPRLFVDYFGPYVYHVIGIVETVKGILAFAACPLFGQLSDKLGRKSCLLVTVTGTCLPVCLMAFTQELWVYAVAQALSGMFASTFTLTFAYIADMLPPKKRAPAYGLALATLGLSFTIGPLTGGYLAKEFGDHSVFATSLVLTVADIAFIVMVLPESNEPVVQLPDPRSYFVRKSSSRPVVDLSSLPLAYNPLDALQVFIGDPLLAQVARVTFLYYTGVWAVVSTLMIYLVNRFHFSKVDIGYLLAAYGMATMISEGLLVRWFVPLLGERDTIRLGLVGFAAQCLVIGTAQTITGIWLSIFFALFSNLVYPSLASLVSRSVSTVDQGMAQGSINGVKALTEGFGPLLFGILMHLFEDSAMPGAPYIIAAGVVCLAVGVTFRIPSEEEYAVYQALMRESEEEERAGLLAPDSDSEDQSFVDGS